MKRFDAIVIGAGPGGYVAAIRGAQLGMNVAVVEKERAAGGTCLHWGCIPTKALLHTAALLNETRRAARQGVGLGEPSLDVRQVMKHKESAVRRLAGGVASLLAQNGVALINGTGALAGPLRVAVSSADGRQEIEGKAIIIATGSVPASIPAAPFDGSAVVSSNEAIGFDAIPPSLLVVGGGAVGLELAVVWSRFGTAVTVVELMPHVLPGGDKEISAELARSLGKQGITVAVDTTVVEARAGADGVVVKLKRAGDGAAREEKFAKVLVAVGRRAALDGLGLEAAGIAPERGRIPTDPWGRTTAAGVFAIGDVTPGPQLAHRASAEGIAAAETIAGRKVHPINRKAIPSCVYTDPEVAAVGATEEEAAKAGCRVKIARFPFAASGKALVDGDQTGWVKLVADEKTDQILGAHIIGPRATELIAEATLAVQLECTCEELAHTIHAHPTLSESLGEAAHAALGAAIHFFAPGAKK